MITIDWETKVISVPKSYMTLVQSTPNEIRELPTNQFRLDLKAIEASAGGMGFVRTHKHNTEVIIGGITYARSIEIINGYTVTFEDGQYVVNLTGSNNNILDVTNLNQVSVRPSNAAGLISNAAIEFSSFLGGVTIDVTSGNTGTVFPLGTPQAPVNNLDDALLIASVRGLTTLYIIGDFDFNGTQDISGFTIVGESRERSEITIAESVTIANVEFNNLTIVSGTLDGEAVTKDCTIVDLDYVNGIIERCILEGTITLGFGTTAHILDSWSGIAGTGTPTIDMGGSGQSLTLRNYNGGIKLVNKTGTESVSIDLASGQVKLGADVTNGTIVMRGIGELTEDLSSGATVSNFLMNTANITQTVWADNAALALSNAITLLSQYENNRWKIDNFKLTIYDDDNTTVLKEFNLFDEDGQPTNVNPFERVPV